MARPNCQIQPENVGMVRTFGFALLAAAAVSVTTGKTYYRGVIVRDETPLNFWVAVTAIALLGAMCVVGSFVC
jgi:hypothetical protein